MAFNPIDDLQDLQFFGEFGGVNPSISDASTYTFLSGKTMFDTFENKTEGCYLYSRHSSPSNLYLGQALAAMEGTEAAKVTASGMGAITATILQLCKAGDHLVSSRTIYGGTYAFMKYFLPKFGITTSFVDFTKPEKVAAAIQENTTVLYGETVSNPLLEVADIPALSAVAKAYSLVFVVDNTFSPLSLAPGQHGADVVIHSLTKYINGASDTVAGAVCATQAFVDALRDVKDGAAMLLGATLDSWRAAGILKNMHTLPVRIKQHSKNALFLAGHLSALGLKVHYPGLTQDPGHQVFKAQANPDFGFGGMLSLDVGTLKNAYAYMEALQEQKVGLLAVSLGYYKTLFNAPGNSTSSEIPEEEREEMGLSEGLIRFSVGLDHHIDRTFRTMKACLAKLKLLP